MTRRTVSGASTTRRLDGREDDGVIVVDELRGRFGPTGKKGDPHAR
jgi:hypothetical protein